LKNGITDSSRRLGGPAFESAEMRIPFPAKKVSKAVALDELRILEATYPKVEVPLAHRNAFELLIAVILSAQCTDARVNLTTPALFAAYPTPQALAAAPLSEVEKIIKACGFFRMKAKNIVSAAQAIVERHGGRVPADRDELEQLPGVGRKTASVVLWSAFHEPALAVDTHVFRVSHRLGLTLAKTPLDVENDLTAIVPSAKWGSATLWLILHGRQICKAPVPACGRCPVRELCPTPAIIAKQNAATAGAAPGRRGAPAAGARRPSSTPSRRKKR